MRLWHKSLIPYLPRQQLLGQWRECCLIAKNIAEKGTPNHLLVNRIMNYLIQHFFHYTQLIESEMFKRGYECSFWKFTEWINRKYPSSLIPTAFDKNELFSDWHNTRYLNQCLCNLEEKYDCKGITDDEWNVLLRGYKKITGKDWVYDIP